MEENTASELNAFIETWQATPEQNKAVFIQFKDYLSQQEGVRLEFIPRPGVTYSLRAMHASQKNRALFAMIDVIEDTPRWLSVCFYDDMITDPDERGDFVPEGLLGENALCFDIEEQDEAFVHYIEQRFDEAWQSASTKKAATPAENGTGRP